MSLKDDFLKERKEQMDIFFKRRSIRKYTGDPVSDTDVTFLLKAAMAAPSAGNQQPWEFIVVRDKTVLQRLSRKPEWQSWCAATFQENDIKDSGFRTVPRRLKIFCWPPPQGNLAPYGWESIPARTGSMACGPFWEFPTM